MSQATFQIASAQPIKCSKIKAGASTIIWQDCGPSASFSYSVGLLNIAPFQHLEVGLQQFHLLSFSFRSTKSFKVQNSRAMQRIEPQKMVCQLLNTYCFFLESEDPAVCLSAPSSQEGLGGQVQGNLWHAICLWILSEVLEGMKEFFIWDEITKWQEPKSARGLFGPKTRKKSFLFYSAPEKL